MGYQEDDISYCSQPSLDAAAEEGPAGAAGGEYKATEKESRGVARAEVRENININ